MKNEIYQEVRGCTTLPAVRDSMVRVFEAVKVSNGTEQIGYVAGIINSDGPDHVARNLDRLHGFTEAIRQNVEYPVFSAVDVFGNGIRKQIEEMTFEVELREQHFIGFWREILGSGHVTDVFFTPRWRNSRGANDEYQTATALGITIHNMEDLLQL